MECQVVICTGTLFIFPWLFPGRRSRKSRLTTVGIGCAAHATPSIRKSWHYFGNKLRWLGRHSSLADQSHGV
jgi:hypothetical protein